jgi:activator of HSP90 ATPase
MEVAMQFTRRQGLAGMAITLGCAAALPLRTNAQAMQEQRNNDTRTALNERRTYNTNASDLYNALLDEKTFASFTHAPAHIDPVEGGAFSLFNAAIVGRNVELVRNARIVQAWRSDKSWQTGVFSIVRFDIAGQSNRTSLSVTHTGFPEGTYDHLYAGWITHYLQPLSAYFT